METESKAWAEKPPVVFTCSWHHLHTAHELTAKFTSPLPALERIQWCYPAAKPLCTEEHFQIATLATKVKLGIDGESRHVDTVKELVESRKI